MRFAVSNLIGDAGAVISWLQILAFVNGSDYGAVCTYIDIVGVVFIEKNIIYMVATRTPDTVTINVGTPIKQPTMTWSGHGGMAWSPVS